MTEHQSPSGSEPNSANEGSPYVVEHYGFAVSHGETEVKASASPATSAPQSRGQAVGRPARMRHGKNALA